MKKYKKYKVEYTMFYHEQLMVYTRMFRDEMSMQGFLTDLAKKENYIKSTKYELDIVETEIK